MTNTLPDILGTPQQFLRGEQVSAEEEHRLGRACVVHCLAAAEAIYEGEAVAFHDVAEFAMQHGAGTASDFYKEGEGWKTTPLADHLRQRGYQLVAQNLTISATETNFDAAVKSGRARSAFEKTQLNLYSEHGGKDRYAWLDAFRSTFGRSGVVLTSVTIPLLSGLGFGRHAVVLTGLDEETGNFTYFDPDYYNIKRYQPSDQPDIERVDKDKLFYQQSADTLLPIMTGEVMHIFPPQSTS